MMSFVVRSLKRSAMKMLSTPDRMAVAASQALESLEPRRLLASVAVDLSDTAQTIKGIGGTYAKAHFKKDAQDTVGQLNLELLDPRYVRVSIPALDFEPVNDNSDPNSADASGFEDFGYITDNFELIKQFDDEGRNITASWFDLPDWMISNPDRENQRRVKDGYLDEVAEMMVQFVKRAREAYGAEIDYLSFNEVDGGYDVKLTAQENADLIEITGKRLAAAGFGHIKFIVGETYHVSDSTPEYIKAILDDAGARPYTGPISYHSWWSETIPESDWTKLVDLGKQYNKPLWSGEMNYYALAQRNTPWVFPTWGNAIRLANITAKTLTWGGAEVAMYWQYQNDFPLMSHDGSDKYFAWHVLKQFVDNFKNGTQIVESESNDSELFTIAGRDTGRNHFATIAINNSVSDKTVTWTGLPNKPLTLILNQKNIKSRTVGTFTPVNGQLTLTLDADSVYTLKGELGTVNPNPDPDPTPTLPAGWFAQDIGTVGLQGSSAYNGAPAEDWTVKGAGSGVAGKGDDFQFAYRKLIGDAQIIVHLANLQGTTGAGAQSGIMLRDTTSSGSKQASLFITPSAGLQVTTRKSNGADTGSAVLQGGQLPRWLKVTREGQLMTFYTSTDGAAWTQAASTTIDMGEDALIGMAVSSRNLSELNTSTFDNVSVTAVDDTPPPPPPPPPPTGQQPFGGTAQTLSKSQHAFLQAENFDSGGEGVAYHDNDSANIGGAYRSEGVDIKAISGQNGKYRISDARSGEWLEYTLNVAEAGSYWLVLSVGSGQSGSTIVASTNGSTLGTVSVPDTGSYDAFTTSGMLVNLSAGQNVLRLTFDDVGANGYGAALDWAWIG